jgi:iron complex transport system ATP-binding protein
LRRVPVTTIVTLHDVNLAAMFCDRIVVLSAGKVAAAGTPVEVLTEPLIAKVFHVTAIVSGSAVDPPHVRFVPPA